jgi:phosphatidylserine decarboxylase
MFPPTARLLDRLVACALWVMPTRAFSRLAFTIAEIRKPWLKNLFIRAFLRAYPAIDMDEAAEPDPERYACFNDFFTR